MSDDAPPILEELPPELPPEENWFDRQAAGYSPWMFWLHLLICTCPGVVVGLLFVMGCNTRDGKDVGLRLVKFSAIGLGLQFLVRVLATMAQ